MTLGYPPDPAPSPPLVQSPASSGRLRSVASRVVVGVCVGVGGTAVLLAICYAVVLVGERRRRRALARRSLFGRTLAPGASPSTSLVVTVRRPVCVCSCVGWPQSFGGRGPSSRIALQSLLTHVCGIAVHCAYVHAWVGTGLGNGPSYKTSQH